MCSVTNINDAVLLAVKMLEEAKSNNNVPENSASMIILLTDGNPNQGKCQNIHKDASEKSQDSQGLNSIREKKSQLKHQIIHLFR